MTNTEKVNIRNEKIRANEYYDTQELFDELYKLSKEDYKFKNLMELIMDEKNVRLAYRRIKTNKGRLTPGTDGKTMDDIKAFKSESYVEYIQRQITNYHPKPVRRVYIPKRNGDKRPLGIPTITDRIVQQCILQVLEPICEAKFFEYSYGFRPNRTTINALSRVVSLINIQKQYYCVDIDIKGFFDNVSHSKLLKQLWSLGIQDKSLLKVISKILKSEIEGEGIPTKGTPQGGVLSPLLSNVVLNELDWWVTSQWQNMPTKHPYVDNRKTFRALRGTNLKEIYIVRYADDFKIMCKTYSDAVKVKTAVIQWLADRLELTVNEEKSSITNLKRQSTEFLGFQIRAVEKSTTRGKHVAKTNMSKSAKRSAQLKIAEALDNIGKSPTRKNVMYYNSLIRGLHNYYKYATHVGSDFGEIHMKLLKKYYNNLLKDKRGVGKKGLGKRYAESFDRQYSDYKNFYYLCNVRDITIIPISGIKHKNPRNFSQEITPYTKIGREKIHKSLPDNLLRNAQYLMMNFVDESVELNDNRVSLYLKQQGRCAVTGERMFISEAELHHKIPKHLGGSDEFSNLCYISHDVHKLVHVSDELKIMNYLKRIKATKSILKKINRLRVLAQNVSIDESFISTI